MKAFPVGLILRDVARQFFPTGPHFVENAVFIFWSLFFSSFRVLIVLVSPNLDFLSIGSKLHVMGFFRKGFIFHKFKHPHFSFEITVFSIKSQGSVQGIGCCFAVFNRGR